MKRPFKGVLLTTTLLFAFYGAVQAAQAPEGANPPRQTKTLKAVPNFVTATDAMMRNPKPEDWIIHRGNYQAWGYSQLQQISKRILTHRSLASRSNARRLYDSFLVPVIEASLRCPDNLPCFGRRKLGLHLR